MLEQIVNKPIQKQHEKWAQKTPALPGYGQWIFSLIQVAFFHTTPKDFSIGVVCFPMPIFGENRPL